MTERMNTPYTPVKMKRGNVKFISKNYHKPMIERFGDRYLQYRREWDSSAKGEYLPPFPIQIDFEIIDYCNLKCIMCPRSIHRGSGTRLPLADFRRVIDEGAEMGLKAVLFGSIDEPLLRKDLLNMISYASSKGIIDIRLNTNATLLNPELSQQLIASGLTYISVSVDAAGAQTYKRIRGGDLDKLEGKINTLLEIRAKSGQSLPVTRVSFVATPENLGEIDDFIAKWSPLVDFVEIQHYLLLHYLLLPNSNMVNDEYSLDEFSCDDPWQRLTVTARGNFVPCCGFQGLKLLMGNIHEHTIAECWNSEKMKKLREQILTKNPPIECVQCYASRRRLYKLPNQDSG